MLMRRSPANSLMKGVSHWSNSSGKKCKKRQSSPSQDSWDQRRKLWEEEERAHTRRDFVMKESLEYMFCEGIVHLFIGLCDHLMHGDKEKQRSL